MTLARLLAWKGHPVVALAARVYLAAIFLLACFHKIADPHAFALDVATYQILPLALVNPVALVLPYVELVAALMLLTGVRVRAGALLVSAMMLVFIVALGVALARGQENVLRVLRLAGRGRGPHLVEDGGARPVLAGPGALRPGLRRAAAGTGAAAAVPIAGRSASCLPRACREVSARGGGCPGR
ncbi:MAG: MauE/DoxX family redox-associated membrane protein [Myxococcales bacterium]